MLSAEARAEIIEACSGGESQATLARQYHVTRSCISKIVKKAEATARDRGSGVAKRVRGRPPKLSPRDLRVLQRKAVRQPTATAATHAVNLLEKTRRTVSAWTVRRSLAKVGCASGLRSESLCSQQGSAGRVSHGQRNTAYGRKRNGEMSSSPMRQRSNSTPQARGQGAIALAPSASIRGS